MKLYHYTRIEAFKDIIEKNELWLSERNCMNDVFDEQYIKNIVKQKLNPCDSHDFNGSILDEDFVSDNPQYVFSTTIVRDAAHHWLSYGQDSSICLVFEKEELEEFFNLYSSQDYIDEIQIYSDYLFTSPVFYNTNEVNKKAGELVTKYQEQFLNRIYNGSIPISKQFETSKKDFHGFYSCVKQNNFSAEKEYRFILFSKKPVEYRTRDKSLISYLCVKINSKKLPVREIILNPYTNDDTIKNNVKQFLHKNKYDIEVFNSEIHLRK